MSSIVPIKVNQSSDYPSACVSSVNQCVNWWNAKKKTEKRKEAMDTFGIAEDHMVHGDLKLYWLRFQYNKWQCGFSFIKQYFQMQLLPTLGVLCIGWVLYVGYGIKIY